MYLNNRRVNESHARQSLHESLIEIYREEKIERLHFKGEVNKHTELIWREGMVLIKQSVVNLRIHLK